ncbi:MAG: NAD(P)H-binding protein [Phycisphaerales bacterium]|nr:NAD(P)H-binding protein [Phycisphaerales bacterium]
MTHQRVVAVAGASGFVGRHIVSRLMESGWQVRALVRSPERARAAFAGWPRVPELVHGDARDAPALDRLVAGGRACVNAIGILREAGGQTFRAAHVGATRALVGACRTAGVERFVQVSALGVTDDAPTPYQRTKFESEQIVRRSGLGWTILRPSLIHGPGSEFVAMARKWVRGESQPWFFLPYFTRGERSSAVPLAATTTIDPKVQPVSVEDVADAVAAALDRPEAVGEVYPLAGPDVLTWPQLLVHIRDTVPGGRSDLRPLGIPGVLASKVARAARALGVGGLLPFDEGMALMGAEDSTASLAKARQHLGFDPRPFRATFGTYAARG